MPHAPSRTRDDDASIVEMVPPLRAFARTFCNNANDADDLVQETLMRALKSFDSFDTGTRMKSWLFTIMRNTFYTNYRKYRREAPGRAECIASNRAMDAPQEWSIRGNEVREAIDTLPDHHRDVLVLIGVLGFSYEEAAAICECQVGTVKSRLSRARAAILEALGETSETVVESTGKLAQHGSDSATRQ